MLKLAVAQKIEEYMAGGGSKFVLRPLCPPEQILASAAGRGGHFGLPQPLTRPVGVIVSLYTGGCVLDAWQAP